mmetsp:Transcript_46872/g.63786  ORF Transcript_46872/g.63786 Transcript_46872/m.63786 type:complete len:135 (-) Transcript_46872:372-776(-)|eukprot:CAMPEP_0185774424 /NCGR_PEP_ID=MMETSP1174-20130828/78086_1 /TAXON_ID=35687 /ORGANISM="Dictyocha speculum, Strain CCMP1381" /LENGTH=134 /DNA_ID=CAMNT_0028461575 /DNA_START=156 /DNA_END=560 /DNA_ORIENTATION=+
MVISDVPVLSSNVQNETRRFITFIDVMYERQIKVALSAEVPLTNLFNFSMEISNEDEEPIPELSVVNQGGSSGRLTTMIDGHVEWSATGRKGVSLVENSALKEVVFVVQRAYSRLVEMQGVDYCLQHESRYMRQ